MTIYVVYADYGYGERSAPKAAFSTYEKAEAYVNGDSDMEIEYLSLDCEERT
jgi:hypothetical protein